MNIINPFFTSFLFLSYLNPYCCIYMQTIIILYSIINFIYQINNKNATIIYI
ncbi:Hypothetical protein EUBREC_1993 [Agathobacter rectalis ATCC 33656]|uniref:Uncharacterized protein n=1 Tax=Agathobacter rectalis (strain ATCC 33656 / DSM 3377 / JCM 17463 / KCTC 5835 / VPI 0990) TaxID=515619 RepID=C4ZBK2_AGARV|nr:Hypothetical protein EUBREC_1993 [Agathobacter rectalis ATCC 33656]